MRPKYHRRVSDIEGIPPDELEEIAEVEDRYGFYANDYYLNLIDWNDPDDPIRRIVVPTPGEIMEGGSLDPSNEKRYTICRGLEHKYGPTALLLISQACGGLCRFCFRKRLFMRGNHDATTDLKPIMEYLRQHREINNVLISGGDPFALSTKRLREVLKELHSIDHIRYARIGSKIPVYDPFRITEDPELIELIREFSKSDRKLYIITDINHPREITKESLKAIDLLQGAGAVLSNQTPLLRGVNDDVRTLKELFNKLASCGIPPYYVFQCRPTVGNRPFVVPIEEGYEIFERAKSEVSGLAKRSKFIMSHTLGKIEIAAMTEDQVIFKFHNAAHGDDERRVMIFRRNPEACWLDDYLEVRSPNIPSLETYGAIV
ncbi:MAG: KamA family radical SAM protein [Thermoplasmatota archaeon]